MIKTLLISIVIILFIGFLYWAYLPDYRRNPKEFWHTIVGIPIEIILGGYFATKLYELMEKWPFGKSHKKRTEN